MKYFLFLPIVAVISFSFISNKKISKDHPGNMIDSAIIVHELDGTIAEWPANKFEEDKTTTIKYAVDNDDKNIFIAMIIPDLQTQMKMIGQGMEMYVDTKGKKKEGKGIRFPVKVVSAGGGQKDIKQLRTMLAPNLLSLQLFGFTDEESKYQEIMRQGSANIQFSWDDKDIMYIEYTIPFTLFGDNASLTGKSIGVGWKIKAMEVQTEKRYTTTTTTIVAVPAGSAPSGTRSQSRIGSNPGLIQPTQPSTTDTRINVQSFWTKYTVSPTK